MRLYAGSSAGFITDTAQNQIAGKLKDAFFRHYRFSPPESEIRSWHNSLRAVSSVFQLAGLTDHGIILEYQLPLTSRRLDCLICGRDASRSDQSVILELKQWDLCSASESENLVVTWLGGRDRETLHPSAQVNQYRLYLEDTHTAFYEGTEAISLSSCAFLHNYPRAVEDPLFDPRFAQLLNTSPTFTADDTLQLRDFLRDRLVGGDGMRILGRIEESRYRPSKRLMDHVSNVIKGVPQYILLDEQLVVFEKVLASARGGFHDRRKTVLIVRGGPGTGKSVIAINLMSDLLRQGYNAHYATGSKAFTETLRKIIGSRGSVQFRYFFDYAEAALNSIDVLICDEAHRLRLNSNTRFRRRSQVAQVTELLNAAKVGVFFIDDKQLVRPGEVGSTEYIRGAAEAAGCRVFEYELEAQFRCAGSDGFVNWVNHTLGIQPTANPLWDPSDAFDFRIFDSPGALEAAIRARAEDGFTARLAAGFCWPWSKPQHDGTLVNDVEIGTFRRPWNAKPEAGRLAKGIPKASFWAHDPRGIDQIGCVYTVQGFEVDYIGVIWGPDLRYDWQVGNWRGDPKASHDRALKQARDGFLPLIKNTYRVLLSRGLKGCYVCFLDSDTERFVRSRIDFTGAETARVGPPLQPVLATVQSHRRHGFPLEIVPAEAVKPFVDSVPVYDLRIAAGRFSEEQSAAAAQSEELANPQSFEWARLPEHFRAQRGLFVAQVVGESMNRRIPAGAWCLFRLGPTGTREGKIVIAQHRGIADAETGGHYTVKRYTSEKRAVEGESWEHSRIVLRPESTLAGFEAIVLSEQDAADLRVIAELVAVLG